MAGLLLAAGLNAHGQLDDTTSDDIHTLRPLLTHAHDFGPNTELLFTGWSQTVLRDNDRIFILGHNSSELSIPFPAQDITSVTGDHNGALYALSTTAELYTLTPPSTPSSPTTLTPLSPSTPPISHLTLPSTSAPSIAIRPSPTANLTHLLTFTSSQHLESYLRTPSTPSSHPTTHSMIPAQITQLVSSTATTVALTSKGEVYTAGDARHTSLGRLTTGPDAVSADKAGRVDALDGVGISKVAAGGWCVAALARDGGCYIWGRTSVGSFELASGEEEGEVLCLRDLGAGEVAFVEVADREGTSVDVLDVAVGAGHLVLLTEGGRVLGVGENGNGQLGEGRRKGFYTDWVEIVGEGATAVFAGPKSTFVKMHARGGQ